MLVILLDFHVYFYYHETVYISLLLLTTTCQVLYPFDRTWKTYGIPPTKNSSLAVLNVEHTTKVQPLLTASIAAISLQS